MTPNSLFMAKRYVIFLLIAVFALIALGITMLASTSFYTKDGGGDEYVTVWKQGIWVVIALSCCVAAALIDFQTWFKWRWWIYGVSIFGLVLCLEWYLAKWLGYPPLIGRYVGGAARWLGVGKSEMRVQPSEFAKIGLVIVLAGWFAQHENLERTLKHGLLLPGLILGGIVALIGVEVDLGNACVAAAVGGGIMFVAGTKLRYLAIIFASSMAALTVGIILAPNRFERVIALFNLEKYKDGCGLQQWISWLAYGSGGLDGRGLGEGRMKLSYLPEAHTDFIFPMVGEEIGLHGTLGTVAAFVILLFSGMCIAAYAPNRFGKLLGFGLTSLLTLEALLNMGVTTALLPNKGLPLPFVSYGGSSLVAAMLAVGILINLHRQGVHLTWDQLPVIRRKRRWTPQL